jgi:creatinine amidohydrolase
MLAIDPARVRVERAESGDRRPLTALLPLLRTRGVRAVSGNGVLGDPAGANAVEGGHLLALAVEQLIALADHLTGSGTGALPREVAG